MKVLNDTITRDKKQYKKNLLHHKTVKAELMDNLENVDLR